VINRFAQPERETKTVHIALDQLTEREVEVLKLAAKGMSNRGIAEELIISDRTVQTHLTNIFNKMGVGSRTEAVVHALRRGWITLEDTL
jgi:DNA-binding NarL/FixJ family response regulator